MKSLHIHAQYAEHQEARIIGTREALEALQKALNQLLSSEKSEKEVVIEMECRDGEAYELVIHMKTDLEGDSLPYVSWKNWDGESV